MGQARATRKFIEKAHKGPSISTLLLVRTATSRAPAPPQPPDIPAVVDVARLAAARQRGRGAALRGRAHISRQGYIAPLRQAAMQQHNIGFVRVRWGMRSERPRL